MTHSHSECAVTFRPQVPLALQGAEPHARQQKEGSLWSRLFAQCLEREAYTDAYVAVLSNPLPAQALANLKQLVHALCERGRLDVMSALPLAGRLVLPAGGADGRPTASLRSPSKATTAGAGRGADGAGGEAVSLFDEVVSLLARKAASADLDARPQPYQVGWKGLLWASFVHGG